MKQKTQRKTGDIAIEFMKENNSESIGYETFGMLDEVYAKAKQEKIIRGFKTTSRLRDHPLNRHQVILNLLDKDERFEKYFIRCTNGRAEILVRMFKLKQRIKNQTGVSK